MLNYYSPALVTSEPGGVLAADFCIYGGTAGGVAAAVAAARLGRRVVLLEPGPQIGGMTASALGYTDIGNKDAIGGLAREFYRAVGRHYGVAEAWTFEPKVARAVFETWLRGAGVSVRRHQYLASVEQVGGRLLALTMESGLTVRAPLFVDATYEGDLLAAAGVSHHIGREDNATYGETLNGAQIFQTHQFTSAVD